MSEATASILPDTRLEGEQEVPTMLDSRAARRIFSLDLLRGVAIALVLITHLPPTRLAVSSWTEYPVQWLHGIGWTGVDLFFVLSGFLISGLIYKEYDRSGGFQGRRFWLRRGFKIWPAYFAAYGLMTLARVSWETSRGNGARAVELMKGAACNAAFLQNYMDCQRWSHSWSLAVEEHFYTVFAIVAAVTCASAGRRLWPGRRAFAFVVPAFGCISIVVLALRAYEVWSDYGQGAMRAYYQSHLRADSLFCGVFLGYCFRYWRDSAWMDMLRWPVCTFGLVCALTGPTLWSRGHTPLAETLGFTATWLGFGLVVATAAKNPGFGSETKGLAGALLRFLAWMGVYSYTIYLFHAVLFGFPGVETLRQFTMGKLLTALGAPATLWLDRIAFLVASVAGGVVLSHAIERPFLALRERILPAGSTAAPVSTRPSETS